MAVQKTVSQPAELKIITPVAETILPQEGGLGKVGQGINEMVLYLIKPSLEAVERTNKTIIDTINKAKEDIEAQKAIVAKQIEDGVDEPKKLFKQCLDSIDSTNQLLRKVEIQVAANNDERLRDMTEINKKMENLVNHFRGIKI